MTENLPPREREASFSHSSSTPSNKLPAAQPSHEFDTKMETLNQPVVEGDLILLYAIGETPYMLYVEFSPGDEDENPSTSSIIVREVGVHYLKKPGYCVLSGPLVYYHEESDDEISDIESVTELGSDDIPTHLLSTYMAEFPPGCGVQCCVNPHGRDVLWKYWGGSCPFCYGHGHYCPGCGTASLFPDLWGGCAVDQSCPVCLGFDFAMDDKTTLRTVEKYESDLRRGRFRSEGDREAIKEEILALVRQRYELINTRRLEMGLGYYDVEEIVDNWFEDGGNA
ncbi:hypothetical protein BDV26DRAFT_288281 [Aspergillus bertholletiae]|uniref:Uncharacterized protein n=1 Tax=Aspergillus bertholletiae TaxID=1226010 RepID=A0A5N7BLP9_9EURO|nr:hypothetical protein BDV26DRAFT_288281 [Aspergillus bertholletiae]